MNSKGKEARWPTIGIVGGAGPMAGLLLAEVIIEICQKRFGYQKDADFPRLFLHSYPFADMLCDHTSSKLVAQQLQEALLQLENQGADVLVIACNTIHLFLQQNWQQKQGFVDLIGETAAFLRASQIQHTLMLATSTSVRGRLHQSWFACSYPAATGQAQVDNAIEAILAGSYTAQSSQLLAALANSALPNRASAVVLGCTELSVLQRKYPLEENGLNSHFTVVDPLILGAEKACKLASAVSLQSFCC